MPSGRMSDEGGAAPRLRRGRLGRLCLKEVRETLRDRRTIVTLVMMPLLVYPLLSMALNRYLLSAGPAAEAGYSVGVGTEAEGAMLAGWLADPRSAPPPAVVASSDGGVAEFRILLTGELSPRQAVEQNAVDVGLEVLPDGTDRVRLIAFRGDSASESARRVLVERLMWLRMGEAEQRAGAADPQYRPALGVEVESVGEEEPAANLLGTIVPIVLVLMTITGAVYPAIDLTAGERERGTMESLMASPVPRSALLFAKYVAVVSVALLTAIANLAAMLVTLWASRLLDQIAGGGGGLSWTMLAQVLGLLVLFSCFFSALLLSLTSFAKSFKEAQAYLIPVMLLSLAPAMFSLMPGVRLGGILAIAPLINIVLLARDLLSGTADPAAAFATVVSTIAYAAAALGVAAKLFGSDAVTRTSERSIGSLFRRPAKETPVPSPGAAALMLAMLVPIYFVVSNGLMRFLDANREAFPLSQQLLLNAAALALSFGLVPGVAVWLGRNRPGTTYRLCRPAPSALLGAAIIGLGAWAWAHQSFVWAQALGIGGLSEERIRQTLEVARGWREVSPWLLIATLALAPAVIEELCFRGYLFSACRGVMTAKQTIVVTSLLFGMFHVLTGNVLLVERFVPTTFLGLILGWIAWRTGSVWPGMAMHLVHNALLELVARNHESLAFLGQDLDQRTHLPASWLVAAGGIVALGVAVLWRSAGPPDPVAAEPGAAPLGGA